MGADGRAQAARVAHALEHARHIRGAVELAHLARHADEGVDERLVVGQHVLGRARAAVLDGVRGPPEQVPPQRAVQELQQRQDARRPRRRRARRVPVQQQREQAGSERVAAGVEAASVGWFLGRGLGLIWEGRGTGFLPFLEILDARHPFLRVRHHFGEQVGKAGPAELGGAGPVQVAVVDGLPVRGRAETGGRGADRQRLLLQHLRRPRRVGTLG